MRDLPPHTQLGRVKPVIDSLRQPSRCQALRSHRKRPLAKPRMCQGCGGVEPPAGVVGEKAVQERQQGRQRPHLLAEERGNYFPPPRSRHSDWTAGAVLPGNLKRSRRCVLCRLLQAGGDEAGPGAGVVATAFPPRWRARTAGAYPCKDSLEVVVWLSGHLGTERARVR